MALDWYMMHEYFGQVATAMHAPIYTYNRTGSKVAVFDGLCFLQWIRGFAFKIPKLLEYIPVVFLKSECKKFESLLPEIIE